MLGFEDGDNEARSSSNMQQVADCITANSAGQGVLVFGDANSRSIRDGDNIRVFDTQNDLTDV